MQRRDFLKYFGVGASVVPLIGGLPKTDTVAKLIEEPKAEVTVVPQMPALDVLDFLSHGKKRMLVHFVSDVAGPLSFECETYIMEYRVESAYDQRYFGKADQAVDILPKYSEAIWELRGVVIGEPRRTVR